MFGGGTNGSCFTFVSDVVFDALCLFGAGVSAGFGGGTCVEELDPVAVVADAARRLCKHMYFLISKMVDSVLKCYQELVKVMIFLQKNVFLEKS